MSWEKVQVFLRVIMHCTCLRFPAQVRPFWKLPSYLRDEGLKARLKIRIDSKGRVISMEMLESSGNEEFDQRAFKAVREVKIFTAPSPAIREFLAIRGVILGFPL